MYERNMVSTKTTKKKVSSSKPSSSASCKYKKVGETKDSAHKCVYVKTGSGTGSDKTSKYYTATIVDGRRKYKVYNGEVKRVPKTGNGRVTQRGGLLSGFLGCSGDSCSVQQSQKIYKVTSIQPPREANIRVKLSLGDKVCYLYLKSNNSNQYIVMGKDNLNNASVDRDSNGYRIFSNAQVRDTIEINPRVDSFNKEYLEFKFTVNNLTTNRSYDKIFRTYSELEYIKKNTNNMIFQTEYVPPFEPQNRNMAPTLPRSNGGKWNPNIQQPQNGNAPRPLQFK